MMVAAVFEGGDHRRRDTEVFGELTLRHLQFPAAGADQAAVEDHVELLRFGGSMRWTLTP